MKKTILIAASTVIVIAIALFFLLTGKPNELPPPKNIIFILIDAVRADHFGTYGCKRNTSPVIDSIARDGIVFENTFSQASWTLASMASMFTSLTPDFNGTDNMTSRLSGRLMTIAEYLGKTGYNRIGASNNPLVTKKRRMAKGFWIWTEYMRDPALTHFCLSYLDPENVNYHRINKDNHFAGFSFDKPDPRLQQRGTYHSLGYFDRSSFKISRKNLKNDQPLILNNSNKPLEAGEYRWGLAVKALDNPTKITVSLVQPKPDGQSVLDSRSFTAPGEWKLFSFPLKLKSKVETLQMILQFENSVREGGSEIVVDDIFIISYKKRKENKRRFIYLHYINPHEPHHIPKEVEGLYLNLFTDNIMPSKLISASSGDPFDMSNGRYILHKMRTETWIRNGDEINYQLNMYDREIRYMDDQVRLLVEYLKEIGEYDDTMFLILADHGEEFLDHGHISHGLSLYKELIHIPLIISYPKALPRGVRVKANIAAIDIFPTLIDLLKGPKQTYERLKTQITGHSLLPLIFGEKEKEPRLIFSSDYFTSQTSVIWGEWELIRRDSLCGSKSVLFNIRTDPREIKDVSTENPEITSLLEKAISRYKQQAASFKRTYISRESLPEASKRDKEQMRKGLMELGYIDAAQDVFGISKKFEDAYCNVVRFRLQVWLILKIMGLPCSG